MTNKSVGISGLATYVPPYRVWLEDWCDWTGNQWPKIREVVTVQTLAMTATIGTQSYRRPWKHLFFVTDMNGRVLERKEFTVVDAPD